MLSEADAAPHVRAMLETTRRRVVPGMMRRTYEDGKRAFDAGEYGRAREAFTQLGQWLADAHVAAADPGLPTSVPWPTDSSSSASSAPRATPSSRSRRRPRPVLLATAHHEPPWSAVTAVRMHPASIGPGPGTPTSSHCRRSARQPRSRCRPAGGPAATTPARPARPPHDVPPPFAPLDIFTFDPRDKDVVPPQALSQELSGWWGAMGEPAAGTLLGVLDLVIDPAGRVVEAHVHQSVNRLYDAVLMQSVKQWRYRPASRGGRPVRYQRITNIVSGR